MGAADDGPGSMANCPWNDRGTSGSSPDIFRDNCGTSSADESLGTTDQVGRRRSV